MRRAGKQDRVIMAITGHKTMNMLMRYDTVGEDEILQAVGVEFEIPGTFGGTGASGPPGNPLDL
jgi:hypothetical protein